MLRLPYAFSVVFGEGNENLKLPSETDCAGDVAMVIEAFIEKIDKEGMPKRFGPVRQVLSDCLDRLRTEAGARV